MPTIYIGPETSTQSKSATITTTTSTSPGTSTTTLAGPTLPPLTTTARDVLSITYNSQAVLFSSGGDLSTEETNVLVVIVVSAALVVIIIAIVVGVVLCRQGRRKNRGKVTIVPLKPASAAAKSKDSDAGNGNGNNGETLSSILQKKRESRRRLNNIMADGLDAAEQSGKNGLISVGGNDDNDIVVAKPSAAQLRRKRRLERRKTLRQLAEQYAEESQDHKSGDSPGASPQGHANANEAKDLELQHVPVGPQSKVPAGPRSKLTVDLRNAPNQPHTPPGSPREAQAQPPNESKMNSNAKAARVPMREMLRSRSMRLAQMGVALASPLRGKQPSRAASFRSPSPNSSPTNSSRKTLQKPSFSSSPDTFDTKRGSPTPSPTARAYSAAATPTPDPDAAVHDGFHRALSPASAPQQHNGTTPLRAVPKTPDVVADGDEAMEVPKIVVGSKLRGRGRGRGSKPNADIHHDSKQQPQHQARLVNTKDFAGSASVSLVDGQLAGVARGISQRQRDYSRAGEKQAGVPMSRGARPVPSQAEDANVELTPEVALVKVSAHKRSKKDKKKKSKKKKKKSSQMTLSGSGTTLSAPAVQISTNGGTVTTEAKTMSI